MLKKPKTIDRRIITHIIGGTSGYSDKASYLIDSSISTACSSLITSVSAESISITGPLTDATNLPVSFLANVQPISVSLPITYVWQATAQATVTHTHAITDSVQFTWSAIGPVTLTLTATNRAGTVTDSHLVVLIEEQRIYLPLIQR